MEDFTAFSVVSAFFLILWVIMWPVETLELILFQNDDGFFGRMESVALWLMILGVVNGVYLVLNT